MLGSAFIVTCATPGTRRKIVSHVEPVSDSCQGSGRGSERILAFAELKPSPRMEGANDEKVIERL